LPSTRWVIACLIAGLLIVDLAEHRAHRSRCAEACDAEGSTLDRVSSRGSGRGSLFDRRVSCVCVSGARVVFDVSWRDHLDWLAARVLAAGVLLGMVAAMKALGRRRAARGQP
jgi:hypothetical protein